MPIYAEKNLYPGINPHLNSALQQRGGGWNSFHSDHLTHMRETLDTLLPETYYARTETSLQIGIYDPDSGSRLDDPSRTVSDVLVYGSGSTGNPSVPFSGNVPTFTLPLIETLVIEEDVNSIIIYRVMDDQFPGKPITRIELLSPANKPLGSHYADYLTKRAETLHSGLRMVELDYLHERRPIISQIPSYGDRHKGAYPYHILVSDPRPNWRKGATKVYSFGVLDTIPVLIIPLDGLDGVELNFGAVYNHTFESTRLFRRLVDYTQLPINFDAYPPVDQARIRQHMAAIADEYTSKGGQ